MKIRKTHWLGWLCLPVVCATPGVWAQTPAEDDLDRLLPLSLVDLIRIPVVTASRQKETRDQTPSHLMVVTRQQIRDRRYKNLADLLEDMPGIDFMRGTKSSQYNQFTVQGYTGPNKLVIMLDGVRIGHPAGGNIPVAENLALYQAKQVEIVYGPAAALYGADAVAGVVNIITDQEAVPQPAWVEVGAGNFGAREARFMTDMHGDEGVSLQLGGHLQQADRAPLQRYYPASFAPKDAKTFNATVVVPASQREEYVGDIHSRSLFARLDVGKRWTLGYYRNEFGSLTSTGDPPATALYLPDAEWITKTDTWYGKFRHEVSDSLNTELVLDYSKMEVDPRAKYVNIYNGYVSGYSYVFAERQGLEQNLNWQINAAHRVQAGLGFQKFYAIETSSLPAPYDTSKSPSAQGYTYRNTNLPQSIYSASYHNVSGYAQLQSEWGYGVSTMAGVRIDSHSSYGESVNPRVGAIWRASDEHVFKALYGEAFRAPSPEEFLSSFGTFDGRKDASGRYIGTSFRIPNFNLEPEKARTLGLTWDWRPRTDWNVVANLYHSDIKNLIVNLPSTAVDAIPGAVLVSPETKGNAGRQSQTGLDVYAQWHLPLNKAWRAEVWGSASWIRGAIDEGNGTDWDISLVADRKAKLGATLRYQDVFTVTPHVFWVHQASNGRKAAVAPNRLVTPGYTLVNLRLGWHQLCAGKATLWLDVNNLLDRRYYAAHGSASRTFFDMPQQPRSWMLSFEHRF